jgi:four helix bundle protein
MKYTRFEELPVWRDAIDLAETIYMLTQQETIHKKRSLCDQIGRAGLSISNNIAEGFERGTTSELLAFLYIARGSAGETRSMTYVLEKIAPDLKSQISDLRKKCESISRQLYRWMESLKDSEIPGQRRLDSKERRNYQIEKDRKLAWQEFDRLAKQSKTPDP